MKKASYNSYIGIPNSARVPMKNIPEDLKGRLLKALNHKIDDNLFVTSRGAKSKSLKKLQAIHKAILEDRGYLTAGQYDELWFVLRFQKDKDDLEYHRRYQGKVEEIFSQLGS